MNDIEALNLFKRLSGVAFLDAIPESAKSDIEKLYRYCFGKPLRSCNCKSIHSDALIELTLFFKKTGTMKDNRKYMLKRGVVIQMPGTTDVFTRDNITDDVSKAYLEKYPQRAKLFEKLPKTEESPKKGGRIKKEEKEEVKEAKSE